MLATPQHGVRLLLEQLPCLHAVLHALCWLQNSCSVSAARVIRRKVASTCGTGALQTRQTPQEPELQGAYWSAGVGIVSMSRAVVLLAPPAAAAAAALPPGFAAGAPFKTDSTPLVCSTMRVHFQSKSFPLLCRAARHSSRSTSSRWSVLTHSAVHSHNNRPWGPGAVRQAQGLRRPDGYVLRLPFQAPLPQAAQAA